MREIAIKRIVLINSCLMVLAALVGSMQPAQAGRFFARGANGVAGGYAHRGPYGQRAGIGAFGPTVGAGIRGGRYVGPNGGTFNTAGGGAYKAGLGGMRASGWNGSTPNGGSGQGWSAGKYNAQTGQGSRASSEQFKTASGQQYGYNGNTNYTKGQGGTTQIDTDNHGDYDVNWAKGQKPIVTPVTSD